VHLADGGIPGERPGQSVLAAARADDEDVHRPSVRDRPV
jgi:hypothetical protein